MRVSLLLLCLTIASYSIHSQSYSGKGNYNRLGAQGKYASLTVTSSEIDITGGNGFLGGFTTRGRLYNNWGAIYGIDFLNVNAEVATSGAAGLQDQSTRFNIRGAQLNLLASYNLIGQNLAIDFGPTLLINGFSLDDRSQESNIVEGFTTLTAGELQQISRINPFALIALTAVSYTHLTLPTKA